MKKLIAKTNINVSGYHFSYGEEVIAPDDIKQQIKALCEEVDEDATEVKPIAMSKASFLPKEEKKEVIEEKKLSEPIKDKKLKSYKNKKR